MPLPESLEDFPESSELQSINTVLPEDHIEIVIANQKTIWTKVKIKLTIYLTNTISINS